MAENIIRDLLGFDIGSNSVGSAWIDLHAEQPEDRVAVGVSVFPAGVEETEAKRGSPLNKRRREKRSQRRSIARRAKRKHRLRKLLADVGLLPRDAAEINAMFFPKKKSKTDSLAAAEAARWDPWTLRREGLRRELAPYEFGRVLIHLNQRRGALGVTADPDDPEEGKVKEAIIHTTAELVKSGAETFGQMMAGLRQQSKHELPGKPGAFYCNPIRNRRDAFLFHAPRDLIRAEFQKLWEKQESYDGPLAKLLTDDLKERLDNPSKNDSWRHRGEIFGQRKTYWDTGTLGRCDLEPTDHRCPIADMYAQEFRVLETVNNIRLTKRLEAERPLTRDETDKVVAALRKQKEGTVAAVRKALGIDKKDVRDFYTLNLERDPDRKINTDWFYREIVHGAFTESLWTKMTQQQQDAVNAAVLKFVPEEPDHEAKLRAGAIKWWNLDEARATAFVKACSARPKIEKRVNLSRRAIKNLLPYMRNERQGVTVARMSFAEDPDNGATDDQRDRYGLMSSSLTKAERHYLKKHPNLLPPAPVLANPVVRKAIHEMRRHLLAYLRKFGRKPGRIVVELTRSARQSEKVRNEILARNRSREKIRNNIVDEFGLARLPLNQQRQVVDRVILCRQQRWQCAYSGEQITERMAVNGRDDANPVELDHIVPMSRSQDNGLNNKVLCFVKANRNKGNQTPKEWLGEKSTVFQELEQRLGHLERGDLVEDYFTKKDYGRKWENLHRDAQDREAFANSQLTDTGYATRQVTKWLRDVFFEGEKDGVRRVFTTKGSYTAILRRDWGLFQRLRNRKSGEDLTTADQDEQRKADEKDRSDHRHHAIDAVVIAMTGPERIQDLARHAEEVEKQRAELEANARVPADGWPRRQPLDPPLRGAR